MLEIFCIGISIFLALLSFSHLFREKNVKLHELMGLPAKGRFILPIGAGSVIGMICRNPWVTLITVPAFLLFHLYIQRQAKRRRVESLKKEIPFISLVLSLLIDAGASVQSAIHTLAEAERAGEGKNFLLALKNIVDMGEEGEGLKSTLHNLYPDEYVHLITEILTQTAELGTGPGKALMEISEKAFEDRLLKGEERALKAPVKLMIPLCLFIFPAIFLLIFTPVIFQLGGIFR